MKKNIFYHNMVWIAFLIMAGISNTGWATLEYGLTKDDPNANKVDKIADNIARFLELQGDPIDINDINICNEMTKEKLNSLPGSPFIRYFKKDNNCAHVEITNPTPLEYALLFRYFMMFLMKGKNTAFNPKLAEYANFVLKETPSLDLTKKVEIRMKTFKKESDGSFSNEINLSPLEISLFEALWQLDDVRPSLVENLIRNKKEESVLDTDGDTILNYLDRIASKFKNNELLWQMTNFYINIIDFHKDSGPGLAQLAKMGITNPLQEKIDLKNALPSLEKKKKAAKALLKQFFASGGSDPAGILKKALDAAKKDIDDLDKDEYPDEVKKIVKEKIDKLRAVSKDPENPLVSALKKLNQHLFELKEKLKTLGKKLEGLKGALKL